MPPVRRAARTAPARDLVAECHHRTGTESLGEEDEEVLAIPSRSWDEL